MPIMPTSMTDEIALNRDVERAAKAKALIENEMYVEVLGTLETSYVEAWKTALPRDVTGREMAWLAIQSLRQMKQHLTQVIDDGKMAKAELETLFPT